MAAKTITSTKIKAALKAGKRTKLYDGENLILRIQSATSASWVFKFTLPGCKPDEMALGSLFKVSKVGDDFDMKAVREIRDRYKLLVAKGEDPKQAQRSEKHERARAAAAPRPKAIGELVRENIHLIAKEAKSERQRQAWIASLQFERIGVIAKMLPEEVADADVVAMMKAYYKRAPVMADDVRQRLSRVLVWAVKTPGWVNPVRWEGHLEDQVTRKCAEDETQHAALDHLQIGEFVAKLRGENERVTNALCLLWLILSATRANEACGADWSEIDWHAGEDGCWVIPASRMKMRREHAVPLTDQHHDILARLKPLGMTEFPASGPIFPMATGKGPSVTGLRKFMQSIKGAEGEPYVDPNTDEPITLHGFRSTFRTWAEEQMTPDGSDYRYSEKLLEQCIAHAVGSTTRRKYVRSKAVEQRRQITAAWATYCGVVQAPKVAAPRLRKAA
jgi:integrase